MEDRIKKYLYNNKEKNTVLFISQGTIGNKLSEIAYNHALSNPDQIVTYKLHPGEYARWEKEYTYLLRAKKLSNFRIIDDNRTDLYLLLSKSEYAIGVYSTAIYEGLIMGCKTILMNLPGIEYMEYLIHKGIVKLADNHNEIKKIMSSNYTLTIDHEYFFTINQQPKYFFAER